MISMLNLKELNVLYTRTLNRTNACTTHSTVLFEYCTCTVQYTRIRAEYEYGVRKKYHQHNIARNNK